MDDLLEILEAALLRRAALLEAAAAEGTDCYRLLHGAVEGAPGVAIDRYGPVLLAQTWRAPLEPGAIELLAGRASEAVGTELIGIWNHRARPIDFEAWHPVGASLDGAPLVGHELGLAFDVSPRHRGQDPLLFLDLRVLRRWLRRRVQDRSVLNLFAYTCGIGVVAAAGGASRVLNVDFARSALAVGRANAERNGVVEAQQFLRQDCFPVLRQLAGLPFGRRGRSARFVRLQPERFDVVVLDPPRLSKGRFGAVDLVADYASLFKPAVLCAAEGGGVVATNNVASVQLEDWLQQLRRCAAKAGRPLVSVEVLRPEADFPSPDDRPPLKIAWCRV
ncbi:MAG TPA: SAM-dependent methyltransferase [Deltaproteobacteria bacterium]|nr:SAM-dependent methyltransferase [Deltaproteobacteria bacterium]